MPAANQFFKVIGIPIPQGQNFVVVGGLSIPFVPTAADGTTANSGSGVVIWATADLTTLTQAGVTFNLSGAPVDGGQTLDAEFSAYIAPPGLLAAPAITEGNVEGSAQDSFAEWLSDYFDGGSHMIGINTTAIFPKCSIKFEQGVIQQPLNQVDVNPGTPQTEIRLTMTRRPERRDDAIQGSLMTAPVIFNFWVRSKVQGDGQGPYLARTVAELLYSILRNPENTLALAENGIKHLQPRGGVTIPSRDWSEKLVACSGELSWWVYFS